MIEIPKLPLKSIIKITAKGSSVISWSRVCNMDFLSLTCLRHGLRGGSSGLVCAQNGSSLTCGFLATFCHRWGHPLGFWGVAFPFMASFWLENFGNDVCLRLAATGRFSSCSIRGVLTNDEPPIALSRVSRTSSSHDWPRHLLEHLQRLKNGSNHWVLVKTQ